MTIHLKLSLEVSPPDCEPGAFLIEYQGEIIKSEKGEVIGKVRAFVLNADRCSDYGHSPLDALDSRQATAPYMNMLSMADAGSFTPTVLRALGLSRDETVFSQDMLIIDRLEVLPRYRGHDYGLQAMHLLVAQLSAGCRLAAIKPFPLQFEPRRSWNRAMHLESFEGNKKESIHQLRRHYERLGFKSAARGLMILDLAEGYSMTWKDIRRRRGESMATRPPPGGNRITEPS